MEITKELVENKFKELNAKLFDGELVTPAIEVKNSFSYAGYFWCRRTKVRKKMTKPVIVISRNKADWNEDLLIEILAHEMIHLYLAQTNSRDKWSHGPNFRRKMRELNKKYSLNLKAFLDYKDLSKEAKKQKSKYCPGIILRAYSYIIIKIYNYI